MQHQWFLAIILESAKRCTGLSPARMKFIDEMCRDISFIDFLCHKHKLVSQDKVMIRANKFMKRVQSDPNYIAELVKEHYPDDYASRH